MGRANIALLTCSVLNIMSTFSAPPHTPAPFLMAVQALPGAWCALADHHHLEQRTGYFCGAGSSQSRSCSLLFLRAPHRGPTAGLRLRLRGGASVCEEGLERALGGNIRGQHSKASNVGSNGGSKGKAVEVGLMCVFACPLISLPISHKCCAHMSSPHPS